MESVGKILKEKRLEKGLILDDVADIIKIRKKYLEAIENGNYGEIPDKVYTKSFLKIYSEFLGLDRVYIVKRYLDEITQEDPIIAPKTYNQHHLSERNYPGEKTSYNRLLYILAGLIVIALFVWGLYGFLQVRKTNQDKANETQTSLTDIQDQKTEEIPESPPVVELPAENLEPKHVYDKLILKITTTEVVWINATVDQTKISQDTYKAGITKSIEASKNINLSIGNAGGLKLNINGFEISNLGKSGDVLDLDITLSPGKSIQVVKVRDNKSETQILRE